MKKTAIMIFLMMLLSIPTYASASTADLFGPNDNTDAGNYINLATDTSIDDNDDGSTDIIEPNNQPNDTDAIDDTTDINGQPDPFDDSHNHIQIQVADEHLIIVETWTKDTNAYIIIAVYDESGRQIGINLTPISTMEKGGRNSYATPEVTPAKASSIKVMLVNESFQPLCEATTSKIELLENYELEPFYCGTPELEQEAEQSLISVEVH